MEQVIWLLFILFFFTLYRKLRIWATGWASLIAQLVKNLPAMRETWVQSLGWEDPLEKGKSNPLQYSGLENSVDWIVYGVAKSRTWLSDFHSLTQLEMYNIPLLNRMMIWSPYLSVFIFQYVEEIGYHCLALMILKSNSAIWFLYDHKSLYLSLNL